MSPGPQSQLHLFQKLLLASAATLTLALPLTVGLLHPSPSQASPQLANSGSPNSFETVAVKPSAPGSLGMLLSAQPGGRFTAKGVTIKMLIQEAYNVKEPQVLSLPSWADSEHYDVEAKPNDALGAFLDQLPPNQRRDRHRQMLQTVLAERFQLSAIHEKKELPVYSLLVADSGTTLQKSAFQFPNAPPSSTPKTGDPFAAGGLRFQGPGRLTAKGVGLSTFTDVLSLLLNRIVLDKTGLRDSYDFSLYWTPEEGQGPAFPGQESPGGVPPNASGPSLLTALQEQLGLRLQSETALIDALLIQKVARPSEN